MMSMEARTVNPWRFTGHDARCLGQMTRREFQQPCQPLKLLSWKDQVAGYCHLSSKAQWQGGCKTHAIAIDGQLSGPWLL